jgi:hypothetical protein
MSTCGTCKHFGRELTDGVDSETFEPKLSGYHACDLVQHLNHYRRLAADKPPAGVQDGSGYFAVLCVSEEFGCNQWEAKV